MGIHAFQRPKEDVDARTKSAQDELKLLARNKPAVTANLVQRVWQHQSKAVPGFTSKYGVDRLVWCEAHASPNAAIRREKQIKEWKRAWKIQSIEADNPQWVDLYQGLSM